MDQVVADGMAPMWNGIGGGKGLIKEMPLPLPVAEPVWIVQIAFRADKMIERAVTIWEQCLARRRQTVVAWGLVRVVPFAVRYPFFC